MRNFKRVLTGMLLLLLALTTLVFFLENQQSVSLIFLGWTGPHLPLSGVVVAALLAGMIVGPILKCFFGRSSKAKPDHLV